MKTPYEVLGVSRRADDAAIRAALRRAAKAYHPDVNSHNPEAEQHLREIIAAYEVLRNPQQRAAYDQLQRRRRRDSLRRLVPTAIVSAAVVSAGTLGLLVWLTQPVPTPAPPAAPGTQAALTATPQGTSAGSGHAKANGDTGQEAEEAAAQPSPSIVIAARMTIQPASGDHPHEETGLSTEPDSAPDQPEQAEGGAVAVAAALHPQGLLATQWAALENNSDLAATWAFASRNAGTPEGALALTHLIEMLDMAHDAVSLSDLNAASSGAVADAVHQRLAHLGATAAKVQPAGPAANSGESANADSDDPAIYLERGLIASRKGNFDRAIAHFDRAIELAPGNPLALCHRANAWGSKGETDRALVDLDAAIRLAPDNPVPYRDRGMLWRRNGALDRALTDLDRAIRLGFADAAAYNERGLVWYTMSGHDRAMADFDRAIKLDPSLVTAYLNRGIALRNKGDLDRAIADFDTAIRIDPGLAAAYYQRGHARSEKQDFEHANADYARARELEPGSSAR